MIWNSLVMITNLIMVSWKLSVKMFKSQSIKPLPKQYLVPSKKVVKILKKCDSFRQKKGHAKYVFSKFQNCNSISRLQYLKTGLGSF